MYDPWSLLCRLYPVCFGMCISEREHRLTTEKKKIVKHF